MGYEFRFDRSGCLNCGVCMDVCPVHALDMTRPRRGSIESGAEALDGGRAAADDWMMEFPVQVGTCIGCQLCATECPTGVIAIGASAEPVALAATQGPLFGKPSETGWVPLSDHTRESLKEPRGDPWGGAFAWTPARRDEPWRSWRSMQPVETSRLVAPCQEACPVGTNAGLYIGLLSEGRDAEALAIAAEHNPFPSICGRVCTAPCELACRRAELDEPVSIRELKRYAADHGADGYPRRVPAEKRRGEKIAIVGAGPTGLSAAYDLARAGYGVTIFEAMPVAGGMMTIGIPEYRLPKRIVQAEVDRILGLGVEIRLNTVLGRDVTLDDLRLRGFSAILLATGASKSQRLAVPGEDAEGVWPATLFLKKANLGEPVELHGDALVVGGGSTAMDAARSAWRAGARSVRVLYRRTRDDMPAQREEVRAAEHEGVVVDELVAPVEVLQRNGWMTGLRCVRLVASGRGADGRSVVTPIRGSEFVIEATNLMVAVGEAPDPSILPAGSSIQVADWGGVVVDAGTLVTAQSDVYAAGDLATGPRSVIEGVAQGQRAAWAIDRALRGLPAASYVAPWRAADEAVRTRDVRLDLSTRARSEPELAPAMGQSEVSLGLVEGAARADAARCLRCDVVTQCPAVQILSRRSA